MKRSVSQCCSAFHMSCFSPFESFLSSSKLSTDEHFWIPQNASDWVCEESWIKAKWEKELKRDITPEKWLIVCELNSSPLQSQRHGGNLCRETYPDTSSHATLGVNKGILSSHVGYVGQKKQIRPILGESHNYTNFETMYAMKDCAAFRRNRRRPGLGSSEFVQE